MSVKRTFFARPVTVVGGRGGVGVRREEKSVYKLMAVATTFSSVQPWSIVVVVAFTCQQLVAFLATASDGSRGSQQQQHGHREGKGEIAGRFNCFI